MMIIDKSRLSTTEVVVHDPHRELLDGTLLTDNARSVARARGVLTLPVDPMLLDMNGISGWAKRSFDPGRPTTRPVLTMYIEPSRPRIVWSALVRATMKTRPTGALRFGADTSQTLMVALGVAPTEETGDLTNAQEVAPGLYLVEGIARISTPRALVSGFVLHGRVTDGVVLWLAASQVT